MITSDRPQFTLQQEHLSGSETVRGELAQGRTGCQNNPPLVSQDVHLSLCGSVNKCLGENMLLSGVLFGVQVSKCKEKKILFAALYCFDPYEGCN